MQFSATQKQILYKLWRHRCFGRGQIYVDNLLQGFPSHEIDKIKNELDKLIKENVIIVIKKKHGKKVYINLEFRKEILKALKEEYPFIR